MPTTDRDPWAAADGRALAPHRRWWSRRDLLIGLIFLAAGLAYTDRVNISVAALAMQQEFGWSQTQKGFVLSSFFIGYMLCLLVSGWLATRFGGKRLLGLAVIVWSVCTLLMPAASAVSLAALIEARIAMGAGESAVFPSAYEIIGRWVPANARTRATGRSERHPGRSGRRPHLDRLDARPLRVAGRVLLLRCRRPRLGDRVVPIHSA